MSLKQTHLKQTPEPLHIAPGEEIVAQCGEKISDAAWFFDVLLGDISGPNLHERLAQLASFNAIQNCTKCFTAEFTERYISGIRSRSAGRVKEEV